MNIGIVGNGFVGKSINKIFADYFNVFIYDVDPAKSNCEKNDINKCDITFLCVPTPENKDGSCNIGIVESAIEWIGSELIVLRSTVPTGTTKMLSNKYNKKIIFQPEYAGETINHPLIDHANQRFIVLGGLINEINKVAELYKKVYQSDVRFFFTDSDTAELSKYMDNSFFAVKVMFCNEFYDLAKSYKIDFNQLREIWLADTRISRDHTFVYPDNRGFSGRCLPKDTSSILYEAKRLHVDLSTLRGAVEHNNNDYNKKDISSI